MGEESRITMSPLPAALIATPSWDAGVTTVETRALGAPAILVGLSVGAAFGWRDGFTEGTAVGYDKKIRSHVLCSSIVRLSLVYNSNK